MVCENCGSEIENGNVFCPVCGQEFSFVPEYNVKEDADFIRYMKEQGFDQSNDDYAHKDSNNQRIVSRPRGYKPMIMAIGICLAFFIVFLLFAIIGKQFNIFTRSSVGELDTNMYDALEYAIRGSDDAVCENYTRLYDSTKDVRYLLMASRYISSEDVEGQISVLKDVLSSDRDNKYVIIRLRDLYIKQQDFDSFYNLYYENESKYAGLFTDYILPTPVFGYVSDHPRSTDKLIISAVEGFNIYYTTDGSDPASNGILYYEPISLFSGDYTIKTRCCNSQGFFSPITEITLHVENDYEIQY